MLKINRIKNQLIAKKKIVLLCLFLYVGIFKSFAQLSDLHYLPPLKQATGYLAFVDQLIYLSTPEVTAFNVNVYKGNNTNPIAILTVSKASGATYNPGSSDNDVTLLTDAKTGIVQSASGLRFEAVGGKKFYVNWRGKSSSQASSLTSKGRAALGTAFKWGGVPNRGTNYAMLNSSLGIMATEDNTTVTIFGYNPACTFRLGTNAIGITNDALTVTLNAGQTYVLEATLSAANSPNIDGWLGASITSTKNIAVNIGEMHYQPSVVGNQDCGIDQIIPENTLGRAYVFVRGNGVNNLEFPVIIATQNGTNVYVNGSTTPIATLNNGDYYAIPSTYYSQSSTTASVPGENMLVTASKEVYAFQSLAGSSGTQTGDINFIAPVNCLLSNTVDNIPNITSMAGTTINGGVTIIASTAISDANIVVKYGSNTVSTTTLAAAKKVVAGTSDWKTYYLPGLSGDVSVTANGPIAVGFFGYSGDAGASGYFSGFETIPTISVQKVGDGCLPSTILTATAGFTSYAWYNTGVLIPGVTTNTYTPQTAGNFTVIVSNGSCSYESATQSVYDCKPEIIIKTIGDKSSIIAGENATFQVSVKYLGFYNATNVVVNNLIPSNLIIISTTPTYGTVTGSGSNYNWNIGTMFNGEEHILTVVTTGKSVTAPSAQTYTVSSTQTLTGVESNKVADDFTEAITIYQACTQDLAGTITGFRSVCEGVNSNILTAAGYNGTIQWQSSTNNSTFNNIDNQTTNTFTATNLSVTTYYRIKAVFGSCTLYSPSVAMTVNTLPIVADIAGAASINTATNTQYTNATAAGVWSSSNPSLATVNSTGAVFGISGGTITLNYTVTNASGCATIASKVINIVQRAVISVTGQLTSTPAIATSRNGAKGTGVGRNLTGELISVPNTPTVSTGTVVVSGNSATISSQLLTNGALTVTALGVCYGSAALPTISDTKITATIALGAFSSVINNLVYNTTYYARAYATNSLGTTYGEQVTMVSNALDGSSSGSAAESAKAIKAAYPNAVDGVYWINVPGYGAKQTYCLMDSKYNGGGWMLALKATRGTTFNYDANYWTTANTLNPANVNRNDGDAKYDVMNGYLAKDMMALWPDIPNASTESGSIDGLTTWSWLQNDFHNTGATTTLISKFGAAQTTYVTALNGTMSFNGYGTSAFSNQGGFTWYGINYTTFASAKVRWGFAWNNENDQNSNDVSSGIGMTSTYGSYSAGDKINCCPINTGVNRSARVEIYIR